MSKHTHTRINELKEITEAIKDEFGKKNILLIMADEFRFPIDKDAGGMSKDLKNILGFQNVNDSEENEDNCISPEARKQFPGFIKLRENAVVLKKHSVATTACVPSRSVLFTGQYGTKNKVTQTDGVFKGASEEGFSWLDPKGIPTLGDWFKEDGYSTHYFGKCHFAHPKKQSLKNWGFDDWETSFPEPHGTLKNNLGMYRDHGFTDLVTTFLRRKGMALDYDQEVGRIEMDEELSEKEKSKKIKRIKQQPWFAVASFTNPHDITTWPVLPGKAQFGEYEIPVTASDLDTIDTGLTKIKPLGIPPEGTISSPPEGGTWRFDMNPGGITSSCAEIPHSWNESLKDKPDCQFDYSIKLGIALAAKTSNQKVANNSAKLTGLPLPLASDPKEWTTSYMQYYAYLHHVLDQQIDKVLQTLDETGLRDDTIVVFVPDHGEYGGSHGQMIQKWHTAYQEAIHVPVVISMPPVNTKMSNETPRAIEELTSHIDIAPTLLGLAGVTPKKLKKLRKKLGGREVPKFVGADLSDLIIDENNEQKIPDNFALTKNGYRDSILFITSDMITEPLSRSSDTSLKPDDYQIYLNAVDNYINNTESNLTDKQKIIVKRMKPGSVVQPAEVHCIRENDWKLVRYRDYYDPYNEGKFQWEMYNLEEDAKEIHNLLKYNTDSKSEPKFVANLPKLDIISNMSANDIVDKATHLYNKMLILMKKML